MGATKTSSHLIFIIYIFHIEIIDLETMKEIKSYGNIIRNGSRKCNSIFL